MDKPNHPNVIRTWKLLHPMQGVSPFKNTIRGGSSFARIPPVSKPHRPLQAKKPPES